MELSIVIVNFNVKYFLEQCLFSVLNATKAMLVEIIVVDNFSKDGSIEYLKHKFPSVLFIELQENIGFARANNTVLKKLKGKYVLLLNPDTLITTDSLQQSMLHLESNPLTGAVGVRMINGNGHYLRESKRGKMSLWNSFTKLSGLTNFFPTSRLFAGYYLGWLKPRQNHKIAVLSGAFIMMRTQLFQTIGGFDERFFMYGEDIELSYAVMENGYYNHYLGNTTILHFKGESTIKDHNYLTHFFGAMHLFNQKRAGWMVNTLSKPFIQLILLMKRSHKRVAEPKKTSFEKELIPFPSNLKEGKFSITADNKTINLHVAGENYTYNEIIIYIENHPHENHFIQRCSSKSIVGSGQSFSIN